MLNDTIEEARLLTDAALREMYALFERYYDATAYDRFVRDISKKDYALLLRDDAGKVRGFSTLEISRAHVLGRDMRVVFSGDTIVDRAFWGSQALAFSWLRHIGRQCAAEIGEPMYWLLTVKGHRTYRYLPTFGLHFTPDWRGDDPELVAIKDALAHNRFGEAYDSASGLLRFPASEGHLAAQWAQPDERESRRSDVRFFLERNPGFAQGDELVCLCRISEDNMRPLTKRVFRQGARA